MRRRLVVAMVGAAALVGVLTGCNPLTGIQQVATGGAHACALHTDGTVTCWGDNSEGQLGDGTFVSSTRPVTVSGLSDAVSLRAGSAHTCAALADGTAR